MPAPEQVFELRYIGVAGARVQEGLREDIYASFFVMREVDGYAVTHESLDDYHWSKRIFGRMAVNGGLWDMQIRIADRRSGEHNYFYENETSDYLFEWTPAGVLRAERNDRLILGMQRPTALSALERHAGRHEQVFDSEEMDHEICVAGGPEQVDAGECEALAREMQEFAKFSTKMYFRAQAVNGDARRPGRVLHSSAERVR
jgi:hypothetical protein